MPHRIAYLYYEAGQAVAAAHLKLTIRRISADPASAPTDIIVPRSNPKARMILLLTGMAAEKKGVGTSSPLRRARNRARVKAELDALKIDERAPAKPRARISAQSLFNQAQDRANAICSTLYPAIEKVVAHLREKPVLDGDEIRTIVAAAKNRPSKKKP
jgi:hypothetical protein